MFEHTPCKHPVIVLKDIKADALEALLNYMYAGYVNVAQNDLARLIKAAETLSIKGLAVPDEPPPGEESKPNQAKSVREERLSPQPKRRRREENGSSLPSTSPPSSPRATTPFQGDGEHSQPRSRTQSESHRTERTEPAEQSLDHPPSAESQPSEVKVWLFTSTLHRYCSHYYTFNILTRSLSILEMGKYFHYFQWPSLLNEAKWSYFCIFSLSCHVSVSINECSVMFPFLLHFPLRYIPYACQILRSSSISSWCRRVFLTWL